MEDSLELPDDLEGINMQIMLSPEQLNHNSRENTPPHSLAYSNSTYAKDKVGQIQLRSPFAFEATHRMPEQSPREHQIIKLNNQNYPINHQKSNQQHLNKVQQNEILSKLEQRQKIVAKGQYKKINPKIKTLQNKSPPKTQKNSPQINNKKPQSKQTRVCQQEIVSQRKTIDKNEISKVRRRVRQLQEALHVQTVISEELRAKLSVVSTLLQAKLEDSGMSFMLNLRNSSRDLKNVDIFVEMNNLQKRVTQKNIIIDRQKSEIGQLQMQLKKVRARKNNSPVVKSPNSPNRELNNEIQSLVEQKESLMNYIEQLRQNFRKKIDYIKELQQEIHRMGDKQSHYTNMERPKLFNELGELKRQNQRLRQQLQSTHMEFGLMEMNYKDNNYSLEEKCRKLQMTLTNQQKQLQRLMKNEQRTVSKTFNSVEIQKDDPKQSILMKELQLLKNQRDHYQAEYRKRTAESAKLYALELKLSALQQHRSII